MAHWLPCLEHSLLQRCIQGVRGANEEGGWAADGDHHREFECGECGRRFRAVFEAGVWAVPVELLPTMPGAAQNAGNECAHRLHPVDGLAFRWSWRLASAERWRQLDSRPAATRILCRKHRGHDPGTYNCQLLLPFFGHDNPCSSTGSWVIGWSEVCFFFLKWKLGPLEADEETASCRLLILLIITRRIRVRCNSCWENAWTNLFDCQSEVFGCDLWTIEN